MYYVKEIASSTSKRVYETFIDYLDKIMGGLEICNYSDSEDKFWIPDFSLEPMCILASVTVEQTFTFMKK